MYVDLLQIQRLSFLKFLKNGINQVFDNINPIIIANRKYIFFSKYYLLKIPSQIDFISINNQFQPSKILDEPSRSFSSHFIPAGADFLSSGSSTTTFPIKYGVSSSDSHFNPPQGHISNVKYAQWFKMDSKYDLYNIKLIKPSNKIWLFQNDIIPIPINFSRGATPSSFFCFDILGWQNPPLWGYSKSVKTRPCGNFKGLRDRGGKKILSSIIKPKLPVPFQSVDMITRLNKNKFLDPLCKSSGFKMDFIRSRSAGVYKTRGVSARLKSSKPWRKYGFNQYLFPSGSDFLIQTKIIDFTGQNENLKRIKKKGGRSAGYLTFNELDPRRDGLLKKFKNYQASSLKFSQRWLIICMNYKKSKHLLWLSYKPEYQNLITTPKTNKILPASNLRPYEDLTPIVGKRPNFFSTRESNGVVRRAYFVGGGSYNSMGRNSTVLFKPSYTKPGHEKNKWPVLEKTPAGADISNRNLTKTSHLTYSSEFYIPVQIIDQISKKMYLRWLLLADLPIQTKRGHFIINGYPKTVIHQIVRSPGIRFKNEDNQILADIISMRGAWMGIQIVYEKNVKAANVGLKRQNKILNKGSRNGFILQDSSSNLGVAQRDKNITSTTENKRNRSAELVYNKNIGLNLPRGTTEFFPPNGKCLQPSSGNFFFQPNRYQYQAFLLQNAIRKSEKIDYLPSPTLNLLEVKHENKTLEKLKYWPRTFLNYWFPPFGQPHTLASETQGYGQNTLPVGNVFWPLDFFLGKKNLVPSFCSANLRKQNPLSIQKIMKAPIKQHYRNQFQLGQRSLKTRFQKAWLSYGVYDAIRCGSTYPLTSSKAMRPEMVGKYYFWHCPYWSAIRCYIT